MSQDQAVAMDFLGIQKGSVKNESQTDENPVTTQAKQEPVATEQMTSSAASAPAEGSKMNFSQAFSLFSKHFNEKGNGNAAVGRGENVYLGSGKEDVKGSKHVSEENVSTQLGLFSQQTGFGSLRPFPGAEQKGFASTTAQTWLSRGIVPPNSPAMRSAVSSTTPVKPPTAQLTIFYAGVVNVYDDVPADKAQAIMLLADSGNPFNANFIKPASFAQQTPCVSPVSSLLNSIPRTSLSLQTSGGASEVATPPIPLAGGPNLQPIRKLQADLPIARKHSLQRFLEKRKDRLMTKAPYPSSPAPMKSELEDQPSVSASPLLLSCQSPSSLTSRTLSGGCCNENSVSQDPSAPPVSAYIS